MVWRLARPDGEYVDLAAFGEVVRRSEMGRQKG